MSWKPSSGAGGARKASDTVGDAGAVEVGTTFVGVQLGGGTVTVKLAVGEGGNGVDVAGAVIVGEGALGEVGVRASVGEGNAVVGVAVGATRSSSFEHPLSWSRQTTTSATASNASREPWLTERFVPPSGILPP